MNVLNENMLWSRKFDSHFIFYFHFYFHLVATMLVFAKASLMFVSIYCTPSPLRYALT